MIENFTDMVGKTIKSVDESSQNCVVITFTDDTKVSVYAESHSSPYSFPYFEFETED